MADLRPHATFLVIDDQEQARYVFRRILTRAGYAVVEAQTGSDGLAKALQTPGIIVSYVNLPDMLGYDLSRRVKSDPATAGIPLLQVSASFTSDESKAQDLQGGADSYLVQPVALAVVLAQIQALLRLKRTEASSSLSARQWQATFDSLIDGLALVTPDRVLTRVNQAFLRMPDGTYSEIEGQDITAVFDLALDLSFEESIKRTANGGSLELRHRENWLRVRYGYVTEHVFGQCESILLVTDITEHRKLQEMLKMANDLRRRDASCTSSRMRYESLPHLRTPPDACAG